MLVTFHSRAYADITLFGEVAQTLLRMMGHSGAVPGALKAEDILAAQMRLRTALAAQDMASPPQDEAEQDEEEQEPPTPLNRRALPLLELLEASRRAGCDVMWD